MLFNVFGWNFVGPLETDLWPKPDFFRCSKILLSCLPVNLPHDAGEEGVFPDTLLPASVVCYLAIQSLADYSLVM